MKRAFILVILLLFVPLVSATTINVSTPLNNTATYSELSPFIDWDDCAPTYTVRFASNKNMSDVFLEKNSVKSQLQLSEELPRAITYIQITGMFNSTPYCSSYPLTYKVGEDLEFGIRHDDSLYENSQTVIFWITGQLNSKVFIEIKNDNGYYLPISIPSLRKKDFRVVLPPDTYHVNGSMQYYDLEKTLVDEFTVPAAQQYGVVSEGNINDLVQSTNYYTFALRVTDGDEYLDDVAVEVNGEIKYTNSTGNAKYELEEGNYTISLSKEGYENLEKEIVLSDDEEMTYELVAVKKEEKIIVKTVKPTGIDQRKNNFGLKISDPREGSTYPDYLIPVSFALRDTQNVERCQLLVGETSQSGYSIMKTILNPQHLESAHVSGIREGEYEIKVRCLGDDESYDISDGIIVEVAPMTDLEEKSKAKLGEIKKVIDQIEELPEGVKSSDLMLNDLKKLRKIRDGIENSLSQLANASGNDIATIRDTLISHVYGNELVTGISTKPIETSITYLAHEDVDIVGDLLSTHLNKTYDELFSLQEQFIIRNNFDTLIKSYNERNEESILVSRSVMPLVDQSILGKINIIDIIPKELEGNLITSKEILHFGNYVGVVNRGEDNTYYLLFTKDTSIDKLKQIRTVVLPLQSNLITGLVTKETSSTGWILGMILGALVIGFVFNPWFNAFDIVSLGAKKKFILTTHQAIDLHEGGLHKETVQTLTQVFKYYDKMRVEDKEEVKELLHQIEGMFHTSYFYQLLDEHKTAKDKNKVLEELMRTYSKLPQDTQKDLLSSFQRVLQR